MMIMTPLKGVNGAGSLATITFKAIKGDDSSDLIIDNVLLGDYLGFEITPSQISDGTVSVTSTQNIIINEFLPHPSSGNPAR